MENSKLGLSLLYTDTNADSQSIVVTDLKNIDNNNQQLPNFKNEKIQATFLDSLDTIKALREKSRKFPRKMRLAGLGTKNYLKKHEQS